MRCDDLSLVLASVADDTAGLNAADAEHVSSCLRCQAELVHYRKLLRLLRALRSEVMTPDEDLLAELLAALRPPATVTRLHRRHRRAAYLGGIAAAATAGAAGALVLAGRRSVWPRLAS